MSKLAALAAVVVVGAAATVGTLTVGSAPQAGNTRTGEVRGTPDYAPKIMVEPAGVDKASEARAFDSAARTAWSFINNNYSPKTGFVVANSTWPYPTIWDIASSMAAYYSARGLGLITDADYKARTRLALETLSGARLYKGFAYGRNYDARTGELVGLDQKPSQDGTGYSSMDLGRLLVWLKIIAVHDPDLAPLAQQVVQRLKAKQIVKGGYLHGEQVTKERTLAYQEGRVGYEQYAATGFDLWGMRPAKAIKLTQNGRRITVNGIPILRDVRGMDRLTSEPFLVHGLELGMNGEMREFARQTLALQVQRYEQTKQVTMASEDALNDKPYYFYYYCAYCNGQAYAINVHTPRITLTEPRWVSTKAAFGWHALFPSKYTWLAMNTVKPAEQVGQGWASGVYEKTGQSTNVISVNTAAVILESALYYKTGKPLITP